MQRVTDGKDLFAYDDPRRASALPLPRMSMIAEFTTRRLTDPTAVHRFTHQPRRPLPFIAGFCHEPWENQPGGLQTSVHQNDKPKPPHSAVPPQPPIYHYLLPRYRHIHASRGSQSINPQELLDFQIRCPTLDTTNSPAKERITIYIAVSIIFLEYDFFEQDHKPEDIELKL